MGDFPCADCRYIKCRCYNSASEVWYDPADNLIILLNPFWRTYSIGDLNRYFAPMEYWNKWIFVGDL